MIISMYKVGCTGAEMIRGWKTRDMNWREKRGLESSLKRKSNVKWRRRSFDIYFVFRLKFYCLKGRQVGSIVLLRKVERCGTFANFQLNIANIFV